MMVCCILRATLLLGCRDEQQCKLETRDGQTTGLRSHMGDLHIQPCHIQLLLNLVACMPPNLMSALACASNPALTLHQPTAHLLLFMPGRTSNSVRKHEAPPTGK